jgi:hypothetical protein
VDGGMSVGWWMVGWVMVGWMLGCWIIDDRWWDGGTLGGGMVNGV